MDANDLVAALRDPRCYPHPVDVVEVVETHISWVLLAGGYAYKLKKPVDFGFVDFSTLALRRQYCEEELRLNRRLAPTLYLDVVTVAGPPQAPRIGGDGPVVEYAVRMRRFDRRQELDALAARGELQPGHIDELAGIVARFHRDAPKVAANAEWGRAAQVLAPCIENVEQLRAGLTAPEDLERLARVEAWTRAEHARLAAGIEARRAQGLVRECHGDLHLRNMVLIDGHVVVFDAIEFNASLRWIDVVAEIAFVAMDLRHRGRRDLAQRFVNAWLEHSGDYAGLALLPFHLVYRAMVRAKVAGLRAAQATAPGPRAQRIDERRTYLALAVECTMPRAPMLVITTGVSGSGKSRLADLLAQSGDAIRIRSDVERKRAAGLAPLARSGATADAGLYSVDSTRDTYAQLARLARTVLEAGFPAIVDATFLKRAQREAMHALARERGVPFAILAASAPDAVLRERVARRAAQGTDPSEATVEVLDRQRARAEPLDDDERRHAVEVDTASPVDVGTLAARLSCAARD